jgi:hypothetical protein
MRKIENLSQPEPTILIVNSIERKKWRYNERGREKRREKRERVA